MIEKIEEKESVGFVVAAFDGVVTVLQKLNGGRWRQHLDLYEAE